MNKHLNGSSNTKLEVLVKSGGIGRSQHITQVLIGPAAHAGRLDQVGVASHEGCCLNGKVIA